MMRLSYHMMMPTICDKIMMYNDNCDDDGAGDDLWLSMLIIIHG